MSYIAFNGKRFGAYFDDLLYRILNTIAATTSRDHVGTGLGQTLRECQANAGGAPNHDCRF